MNFNRFKSLRVDNDITQKEMAAKLGVKRSTYAGWENGIDSIPLLKLNDFCNFFQVSLDYICNLTDTKRYFFVNYNIDKKTVGNNLKYIRKLNHHSQEHISNIINIYQSNYSRYELGKNLILTATLIEFCKYYHISMDYICGKINDCNIQTKD